MIRRALPFVLGQAGWIAVAFFAAGGRPSVATLAGLPVILANLLLAPLRWRAALLVAVASFFGPLADAVLVRWGLIELPEPLGLGWLMPAWWWVFWGMFASTLTTSFAWLQGRHGLSPFVGAIGGPLSYAAGAQTGAIGLGRNPALSLAAIGLEWGVLMPLLMWFSSRLCPLRETRSP